MEDEQKEKSRKWFNPDLPSQSLEDLEHDSASKGEVDAEPTTSEFSNVSWLPYLHNGKLEASRA